MDFILDLDLLDLNVGEAIICCVVFGLGSDKFWAWIHSTSKIMSFNIGAFSF